MIIVFFKLYKLRSAPLSMKVFLSSTYEDLQPHREQVQSVISDYELTFLGMERFGASPYPPLQSCRQDIDRCDVFICMLGSRYGDKPADSELSYTHHEINHAELLGKPILAYVLSSDFPVSQKYVETDEDRTALLHLKSQVKNNHTCAFFTTPDTIARRIAIDLTKNFLVSTEKGQLVAAAARRFRETAYDAEARWYDCWYRGHWQSNQPFETIRKIIDDYGSSFCAPPGRARVLDCACGTGNSFVAFSKASYEVFGTDGSREMLNFARKNCLAEGISIDRLIMDPTNWVALSLDKKQFDNKAFDLIVNTANSFCHIPSTPEYMHQALSNFYGMLNPGGLLVVDTKKYVREDAISGVPIYKELQYQENENAWHIRTDRRDRGHHPEFGEVYFHTWIHHDVDYSFTQRVNRALIVLTVYGEKAIPETLVVPYYPLPARLLKEQMEFAGFKTRVYLAREGITENWKYDVVVGQKP